MVGNLGKVTSKFAGKINVLTHLYMYMISCMMYVVNWIMRICMDDMIPRAYRPQGVYKPLMIRMVYGYGMYGYGYGAVTIVGVAWTNWRVIESDTSIVRVLWSLGHPLTKCSEDDGVWESPGASFEVHAPAPAHQGPHQKLGCGCGLPVGRVLGTGIRDVLSSSLMPSPFICAFMLNINVDLHRYEVM